MKKRQKKNSSGINLNIHLSNKVFYSFLAVFIVAVFGVGIYAYGTSNPSDFGHSLGEVDFPSCSDGQVLKYSSGSLSCGSDDVGGSTVPDIKRTNSKHNGDFGGWKGMNDWIQNNGCSGYHVCTSHEVMSYLSKNVGFSMLDYGNGINPDRAWYYSDDSSLDEGYTKESCFNWDNANPDYNGLSNIGPVVLSDRNDKGAISRVRCDYNNYVLCCK